MQLVLNGRGTHIGLQGVDERSILRIVQTPPDYPETLWDVALVKTRDDMCENPPVLTTEECDTADDDHSYEDIECEREAPERSDELKAPKGGAGRGDFYEEEDTED